MLQRILGFVLLALVAVWPAAAREWTTADGRPVRTVAVMSRFGDYMFAFHMPTLAPAIRAKGWTVPVENWKIDERVEERIGRALAPRYTVVPLTPAETAGRGTHLWFSETAVEGLRGVGMRPEVDAYVVAVLARAGDDITNVSIELMGVGFYHHDDLIGATTAVFAAFEIMVVDAKTGQIIARQESHTDRWYGIAFQEVDDKLWPGEDKMPGGLQIAPIRDALTALIDESLEWTLKEMAPAS